jgi:hypothetical protein
MRWIEHVSCMVEMRYAYRIIGRKPEEKTHVGGKIILKWILK